MMRTHTCIREGLCCTLIVIFHGPSRSISGVCVRVLTGCIWWGLWSKGFRERNKRTHICIRTYFTPAWLPVNKVSLCPLRGKWQHDKRVEGWRQGEERGWKGWGWREYREGLKTALRHTKAVATFQGGFSFSKCEAWMNSAHTDHPDSSKNSNSGGWLAVTTCLPAGVNAA